jgi:hypothetical protein
MAEQDIKDEMEVKFHFVLPGQEWGKYKAGEVVELLAGQAYGWEGVKISKGYVTEKGATNAAERDATVADAPKPRQAAEKAETPKPSAKADAPKPEPVEDALKVTGAKEVTNGKQ